MRHAAMTNLSINLNKIALLRNQRHVGYPDPVKAGRTVLDAGAHGLTVHPRPDERHIRRSDVPAIAALLDDDGYRKRGIELNVEGNPFHGVIEIAKDARADQVTFVPDAEDVLTSDQGWDVRAESKRLRDAIAEVHAFGARVSLFMDAVDQPAEAMALVAELGADRIELYTEPYASSFGTKDEAKVLERYVRTALAALDVGLGINAGHDLTVANLPALVEALPRLDEVSIGHAFTSDALWWGFDRTVGAYLTALRGDR